MTGKGKCSSMTVFTYSLEWESIVALLETCMRVGYVCSSNVTGILHIGFGVH
jgi:hypothetical protein